MLKFRKKKKSKFKTSKVPELKLHPNHIVINKPTPPGYFRITNDEDPNSQPWVLSRAKVISLIEMLQEALRQTKDHPHVS